MPLLDTRLAGWARRTGWARPLGIRAYHALDRLAPAPTGPRVLVNAVPKAGTHLLMGLLDAVPGYRFAGHLSWVTEIDEAYDGCREATARLAGVLDSMRASRYTIAHAMHHPLVSAALAERGVPVVTMVRDARAVVASGVRYFEENPLRRREIARWGLRDRHALAQWVIDGGGTPGQPGAMPSIAVRYQQYVGWLTDPTCLVVRFEDLVGARGGANDDVQLATVARILDFAGLDDRASAPGLARGLFSQGSHTFSVGRVASWQDVLTPAQVAQVEASCAEAMTAFGYVV